MIGTEVRADGVIASLRSLRAELANGMVRTLERTAAEAKDLARSTTAFRDRTGALRGSIETRAAGWTSDAYRAVVRAGAKQAVFVEAGTVPHVITARRAKALRFVVAGRVVFRGSVRHPGRRATHFMHNTAVAMEPLFVAHAREMVAQAVARFNG